jgi:thioredoxin 1
MQEIDGRESFDDFVREHPAAALWFSGEDCQVCHVLFPRVSELLAQEFPQVALARVDCTRSPELAALQGVFSIPTLLLYFDGREVQRLVRNFGLGQVREALERPYRMLFE